MLALRKLQHRQPLLYATAKPTMGCSGSLAIGPPPLIFSPDGQGLAQYTLPCIDLSPPQYARIDLIPRGRFIATGPPTAQVAGAVTAQSPRPQLLAARRKSDQRLSMVEIIGPGGLYPLGSLVGPHNGSRLVANVRS
jgi:hypothetical protein